jgi:hypothetical protein
MDKDKFWKIIDNARREAGDWKDMLVPVQDALFKLNAPDILIWQRILEEYMNLSFKDRLWAAAEIINGVPCFEKDFENFQRWLVSQGKKVFVSALENPGSLAGVDVVKALGRDVLASDSASSGKHLGAANFEAIEYAAVYAYEKKPGNGDFYEALEDYELTERERADMKREILYAKDIDIEPGKPDEIGLEKLIAVRQAFPELYALFNDVTATDKIQNYDFIHSVRLGVGSVIFMENKSSSQPYLVCDRSRDNPFGADEFRNAVVSKDYLELMRVFIDRVSGRVAVLEAERNARGIPLETLTAADCVPGGLKEDLEGKVVVLKPEKLAREYQTIDYQLVLVTGGFGARPNASGRKIACTDLYTGKHEGFNRDSIAGVFPPERLPDWAKEKLAALQKPAVRESVLDKLREGKKDIPPREPKDKTHRKDGPEL